MKAVIDNSLTIARSIANQLREPICGYNYMPNVEMIASHIIAERKISAGYRRVLFMAAAHCQGGHSIAGEEISDTLGVPFPLNMENLKAKAKEEGFNPQDLWPWWKQAAG